MSRLVSDRLSFADLVEALRPIVREVIRQELDERLAEIAAPDWLTLEEAGVHYRTSAGALRKRAQRGQLPGAVRDGARWLVNRRALDGEPERYDFARP